MFLNKIRTFFVSRTINLCPQQMLRARANGETFVSATMRPRLPGPLVTYCFTLCRESARYHTRSPFIYLNRLKNDKINQKYDGF